MKILLPSRGFDRYESALARLGAEAVYEDCADCAGLLLPGGCDIDPALYGQPVAGAVAIDAERDRREAALFEAFVRHQRPVFGICRGMQLINVLLGGTLHQDIPGHVSGDKTDLLHDSRTNDPALISLYGERFTVNSLHHQSVDRPGERLYAVQWADDGTIEALRHESLPVFGVQWHPERLRAPTDGDLLLGDWLSSLASPDRT